MLIMLNHLCWGSLSFYRMCFVALGLSLPLGVSQLAVAGAKDLIIVTDIAPVHSLVTMVVGEHANVELLVPPSQSPHDYSLKPSQVSAINNAQLVIILSDNFTPSIGRHLKSIKMQAETVELSQATAGHNHDDHQSDHDELDRQRLLAQDPHTWLNPDNAIQWLQTIATAISQVDEQNAAYYQANADQAIAALTAMHNTLIEQLVGLSEGSYVVYHDAYRHFADRYKLREPVAIALSDARAPGAAKLRSIRTAINSSNCVFSEVLHDDAIIDMVSEGAAVNRGILDPIGSLLPIGPTHYIETMKALANSFQHCLQD